MQMQRKYWSSQFQTFKFESICLQNGENFLAQILNKF